MDTLERKLLIEQTRKEILDEINKFRYGYAYQGQIKSLQSGELTGFVFVIPDKEYKELFGGNP